jgi:hypothetical protein
VAVIGGGFVLAVVLVPLSWFAVLHIAGYKPDKAAATKALPSWRSLGVIPAAWQGDLVCLHRAVDGCHSYQGTLTVAGTARSATTALQSSLHAHGFRVDSQRCGLPAPTGQSRCVVAAGNRSLTVVANVKQVSAQSANVQLIIGNA